MSTEVAIEMNLKLAQMIAQFRDDPLGYVLFNWPWGEPGPLERFSGPRKWQADYLKQLGEEIKKRGFDGVIPVDPIDMSTASGHGIGKSALTAWLVKFIFDTRPFSKGIVTANTSDQLKTKTWAELGKWHNMSLTKKWARYNASKGNMNLTSVEAPESWRCDAIPWRKELPEAFAGLHAVNSTPYYIFDEASNIPEEIFEVSDGGLTDGEPMRFMFGNPTRNSGRFFESHNRRRHRYITRQIDSRDVPETNHRLFEKWEHDYGEDSDFFRVRVRGMFPQRASTQFIGFDLVRGASQRELPKQNLPVILGVDVARFGDDQSCIYPRMGRDARQFGYWTYRELDTMQLAAMVIEKVKLFRGLGVELAAVMVDGGGVGGGVVDRLRQLGLQVIEVNGGTAADNKAEFANRRAEMWAKGKEWLAVGCIPDEVDLEADLTGVDYGYNKQNLILLESKEDMKDRGLASPDIADALMLTFSYDLAPTQSDDNLITRQFVGHHDYDPLNPS